MNDFSLLWLSDPACQNAKLVGSKGATLARLLARSYLVPSGFCLSLSPLSELRPRSDSRSRLDRQVVDALRILAGPWAVRSSSTAEDGPTLSFSGIFKTVLGLRSHKDVLNAIDTVLSSPQDEKARHYIMYHGLSQIEIRMSVVVQTVVNADVSGVAFSRHPITGIAHVVIDANYGLGETVADGSVIPDNLEVTNEDRVRVIKIGSKREKLVLTHSGLRREQTTPDERQDRCLSDQSARLIAAQVRAIEKVFGTPQDIEWCIKENRLFIVQARPITAIH